MSEELDVLFDLIVDYDEVVEVLDLGALDHDGFADVHELCFSSAYDEAAFESADCACCIVDDVGLDYTHRQSLLEL